MTREQHVDDELRIAEAGRCSCGSKVVRGFDDTGELVTADAPLVDAVTELLAHTRGRLSFSLALQQRHPRGLVLHRRTRLDIKRRPAGFKRAHIVVEHDCADREAS